MAVCVADEEVEETAKEEEWSFIKHNTPLSVLCAVRTACVSQCEGCA